MTIETIKIIEALKKTIKTEILNVSIESNSQITINTFTAHSHAPKLKKKFSKRPQKLVTCVKNIVNCPKKVSMLADSMTNKSSYM